MLTLWSWTLLSIILYGYVQAAAGIDPNLKSIVVMILPEYLSWSNR